MSGPRTKRQFAGTASDPSQRQITSFFDKPDHTAFESASSSTSSSSAVSSPSLPVHVQANLLSVGMRVRKSVPEGYKTGSSCGSFSLWSDKRAAGDDMSSRASNLSHAASPSSTSGQRELLPFCGIHKVGGLATQPDFSTPSASMLVPVSVTPSLDDVPSLTSSQESAISDASFSLADIPHQIPMTTASPAVSNRKRLYTATEEDSEDGIRFFGMQPADWLDGQVSPRSTVPAGWMDDATGAQRAIAVPRRRSRRKDGGTLDGTSLPRQGEHLQAAAQLAELGQENLMVVDGDFEEAGFLDFGLVARGTGAEVGDLHMAELD